MANYIGKVQIDGANTALIGSTLFGICKTPANTAAKTVTATGPNNENLDPNGELINTNYNQALKGTTIHVKFTEGNTVTTGLTLLVGTLQVPYPIVGKCTCNAGAVISFTLDEAQNWVVNDQNTEYEFMTAYNASTNKVATASDLTNLNIQDAAHKDVVTDLSANTTSTNLPTAAAVATYVQNLTGGLSGLTGAMHFRGTSTVEIHDGDDASVDPTINGYDFRGNGDNAGDVVLYSGKEFVWTGTTWELLGDEGSYALKSSTDTITEVGTFTANTLPTLTVTDTDVSLVSVTNGSAASLTTNDVNIPNVTSAGTATTASVAAGILNITLGSVPTIAETPIKVTEVKTFKANTPTAVSSTPVRVGSASGWNAGSQASLTTNDTTVVVPNAPNP